MSTKLSDDDKRLGVRTVTKAPGDLREFPGTSYRGLTRYEKRLRTPNVGGRERAEHGADSTDDWRVKKLADVIARLSRTK